MYTAQRQWAADHRVEVGGFITAILDAVAWILDPGNCHELPAMLVRHLPHMPPKAASEAADALHSPRSLLKPGLPIDMDGVAVVLALRARYGEPKASLGPPERYLDMACYDAVTGGL